MNRESKNSFSNSQLNSGKHPERHNMIELNNSYNNGLNEMIERNPKYEENKNYKKLQIGNFSDTIKLTQNVNGDY